MTLSMLSQFFSRAHFQDCHRGVYLGLDKLKMTRIVKNLIVELVRLTLASLRRVNSRLSELSHN